MKKLSKRRTSKLVLIGNCLLAWMLCFYSVYHGEGVSIIATTLSFIGAIYGGYMGVGHLDYRQIDKGGE